MSVFVCGRRLGLGLLGSHAHPCTEGLEVIPMGLEVIPVLRQAAPRRQEKGAEMLSEPNIKLHCWVFGTSLPDGTSYRGTW